MSDMSDLFQSYVPEPPKEKKRLISPVPLRLIVPNAITLFALCLGLTAIRFGFENRLEHAVWAIVIAAILDGFDGRVARFFKGASRFGVQLDSLADLVNFGVAPAMLLYQFSLQNIGAFGWVVSVTFAIALCLRLARFNVMTDNPERMEWQKDFFTGLPAPACALTGMLPLYCQLLGMPIEYPVFAVFVALFTLAIAFLAISNIPVYAGKTIGKRIKRQWVAPILLVLVACFGLMIHFKIESLAIIAIAFLVSIPFGASQYHRLEKLYGDEKNTVETANDDQAG